MASIYVLVLAAAIFLASVAHSFTIPGLSPARVLGSGRSTTSQFKLAKNSEFSVIEDDDDDEKEESRTTLPSDFTVLDSADDGTTQPAKKEEELTPKKKKKTEYAALSPGTATTLQIQVGDLALARKAWKKRRRSGSPLLVPCSVLNMDRTSMLRGNIVFLLYKFGSPQKDGVVISLSELKRRYKSHLQGQLKKHAEVLGYESPRELLEGLFLQGKANQESWGARLISPSDEDEIYLKSPLSKYRALQKATQATLLQVTTEVDEGETADTTTMKHTGYIRCKKEESDDKDTDNNNNKFRRYRYPPLSAAIRVSQKEDVETGVIQQGSIHPAVYFGFDNQGDGGSPLLTLSLNSARRPTVKRSSNNNNNRNNNNSNQNLSGKTRPKYTPIRNPRHLIDELKVGDGPFDAKVVRLGKGHALIDFGVGRKFSSSQQQQSANHPIATPDFVKVYGQLRFKDAIDPRFVDDQEHSSSKSSSQKQSAPAAVEADVFASMEELLSKVDELDQLEDGEEMEDISHLFSMNEDGSMNYNNPETGEIEIVNAVEEDEGEDDDLEDDDEEDDDVPVTFDISDMSRYQPKLRRTMLLRVGDRIPVHILSVSKQSSQFMVTTDPAAVKGKKAKDIKKQSGVSKKLEKLSQLLGGLDKAEELKGREYRGTVKATSQTGDWLYVQAETCTGDDDDEDDLRLPVGVATIPEELAAEYEPSSFAQGDLVRIQLDGIDESRGQLAMRVLEKLSP